MIDAHDRDVSVDAHDRDVSIDALCGGLLPLAAKVLRLRAELQGDLARAGPGLALPQGMLDAIVAASLARPGSADVLRAHYTRTLPALVLRQRAGEALFAARLDLRRMPRLSRGLEALFALVADAGVPCAVALGAATPDALISRCPTLGALYASCHFGASSPLLYGERGSAADLDAAARGDGALSPQELIDARYVSPLLHELAHLRPHDPALIPAPANVHEALAAFLGSEAFPDQIDGPDALPGAAFFASTGAFLARAIGLSGAVRAQAGALDLRAALGPACDEALRLYGWTNFLDTGAPHLLSDAFTPGRWWKLLDVHRDAPLARELHERLAAPMLRGDRVAKASWDAWLDGLPWSALPSSRDEPGAADRAIAARAHAALRARSERHGASFRVVVREPPGALALDRGRCELRAPWPGPDAVGAPPALPYPPALCRA